MIKKNFTFVLPDEPYKTTTALNQVVNATYDGFKYLVMRVEDSTGIVHNIARGGDNSDALEIDNFVEEGFSFFILDATEHPFEAAYLTSNYTHETIEDPTFVLPNDLGSWTYHYDDNTGGINQCFYMNTLKYNPTTKTFTPPKYREHALTRESVIESAKIYSAEITKCLAENDYSDEDRAILEEHAAWLLTLEDVYQGVDHWKIPFPTNIPFL